MIDIQNMPAAMKRLKELLPLVTTDKKALIESAETVAEYNLENMDYADLREFYFKTVLQNYRIDPESLQCEMEMIIDLFDEPETDNDIIIPFKD